MGRKPTLNQEEKPTGRSFDSLTSILEAASVNPLPETYKAGRAAQLQTAKWAGTLFEGIEASEKGSYIVSGLPMKISDTDFEAFSMGVAQILYNLEGRPAAGGDSGFRDVEGNAWYADAVAWARSSGVQR